MAQLQTHLDLIWQAIEDQKGVGGKTVRILGPIDMRGLPIQNTTPSMPARHVDRHQNGGTDEITVTGLSGLLGDNQTPFLMAAGQRGGAKLGDVFVLASEILTLSLHAGMGLQKMHDTELALKQQTPVAPVASADATDDTTAYALVNEIKTKFNELLIKLKLAEIMPGFEGYFNQNYFHPDYWAAAPSGYFRQVV